MLQLNDCGRTPIVISHKSVSAFCQAFNKINIIYQQRMLSANPNSLHILLVATNISGKLEAVVRHAGQKTRAVLISSRKIVQTKKIYKSIQ